MKELSLDNINSISPYRVDYDKSDVNIPTAV